MRFCLTASFSYDIFYAIKEKIYLKSKTRRKINLEPYSGKWVAFIDNQPIAWAETLKILMEKLKKSKPLSKEPSVMLIPRKDEGPYILILRERQKGFN